MRKWLVPMLYILILLMAVTTLGCWSSPPEEDNGNPDPGTETPGGDIGDPDDQNTGNDNNGNGNSGDGTGSTSTDLTAPVTLVPGNATDSVYMAVIRLGDLWLSSSDGQMWRQTDTGDVSEVIWAPDGHALAYFRSKDWIDDLYYFVPGSSPVLVDKSITVGKSWWSTSGLLWSPDSTGLAYGIAGGEKLRITGVPGLNKKTYSQDNLIELGPYWLTDDALVYGSRQDDLPSVFLLNSTGDLIVEIQESTRPYPVPGGVLVVTGIYDPEGMMQSFYYSGLARIGVDGAGFNEVYDQSLYHCVLARNPADVQDLLAPRYIAISNGENLIIQQYAGRISKLSPTRVELMTQDMFVTYSEFLYPLWFDWAPDGSSLAALRFNFTREGDYGEQEGYWDLLLVDMQANQELLLEELYLVSDFSVPIPFQGIPPLNWSPCGNYVNYLMDTDGSGVDLWKVDIRNKGTELVLESSGLPIFRPAR